MTITNFENADPSRGQAVRVLLVEDSVMIRDSLIDLIECNPQRAVAMATDSEVIAKAALANQEYDIAIIDLELNEGSGQGVLRFLLGRYRAPLRIVLTNSVEPRVREECLALGADYFFNKSRQFDDVSQAIDRHLARPAL